jgi:flagellar assembly factor FliW
MTHSYAPPERASATCHTLETTRFGAIEVEEDLVIRIPEGLIGFEECRQFVVLHEDAASPFRWLQALDNGAIAFPVIDPWTFKPDYQPTITDLDAAALDLYEETPKLVFVIVTVPADKPQAMTANLLGPLVINPLTRRGRQVIVTDDEYTTRHGIVQEMSRAKSELTEQTHAVTVGS